MIIFGHVIRKAKTDIEMHEYTAKAVSDFVQAASCFHFYMEEDKKREWAIEGLMCLEELKTWNWIAYKKIAYEGWEKEIEEMRTWLEEHPAE